MVKSTPWGARGGSTDVAEPERDIPDPRQSGTATASAAETRAEQWDRMRAATRTRSAVLRRRAAEIHATPRMQGKWGYLLSAFGLIVAFALMFEHWMQAKGPDGTAKVNAFGKIDATTSYLTVWSSHGPNHTANLTGFWAIAASGAIAVAVAAVGVYISSSSPKFARIATGASAFAAAMVLANLMYLAVRQKHLKDMTARKWDTGGQIGSWLNWAFNNGTKPAPGLDQSAYVATATITTAAIAAVIIAFGAAVVAAASLPESGKSFRFPWRLNVTRADSAETSIIADRESAPSQATPAGSPAPPPPAAEAQSTDTNPDDIGPRIDKD